MNLESIVTSLELSKKLEEIGLIQVSLFYWLENFRGIWIAPDDQLGIELRAAPGKFWSAFTAEELLKIIKGCYMVTSSGLYFSPEQGTDNSYTYTRGNIADQFAMMLIEQHKIGELEIVL